MNKYSKKVEAGLRHMLMAAMALRDDIGSEGRKKEAAELGAAIAWLKEQMRELTPNAALTGAPETKEKQHE